MPFYTGIGSRSTPPEILERMFSIAVNKEMQGWTLRSGGAEGADESFERGSKAKKEIWLPWPGFRGNASRHFPSNEAFLMAKDYHPNWSACSPAARKLHARNCHQVLGQDLNSPSLEVICWTEGGRLIGGTATALRIAADWRIPIVNLGAET